MEVQNSASRKPRMRVPQISQPQIQRYSGSSQDMTVEQIYQRALTTARGGSPLISLKAPALSNEFCRSSHASIAQPGVEGALLDIVFPSDTKIHTQLTRKHGSSEMFGYRCTAASDAFPAGYGERSAQSTVKEDTTFQLKGAFPTALLALSKLQARVEARGGDIDSVTRLFGRMWGLPSDVLSGLPKMHVDGSEHTRMGALEDRAYHALSCHPAYSGGYRVDMATINTDAFGESVPINWARIRTGAKTIAMTQLQGDREQYGMLQTILEAGEYKWTMDITQGSQPSYRRSFAWEAVIAKVAELQEIAPGAEVSSEDYYRIHATPRQTLSEMQIAKIMTNPKWRIQGSMERMANIVREESRAVLDRTVEIMLTYDRDRALADEDLEDEFDELGNAKLRKSFQVPAYKVTRSTLRHPLARERIGSDDIPDMRSHGLAPLRISRREFRAAGITAPLDIPGAFHLAVYMTVVKPSHAISAYRLLSLIKDPNKASSTPLSVKLRQPRLYRSQEVLAVGRVLFADDFMGVFDMLCSNLTTKADNDDTTTGIKAALWGYLAHHGNLTPKCPVSGGWQDLVIYLRTSHEGWRLYYWARMAIGRLQYAMSSSILAPIAAGTEVDFLSLIKSGIKERAMRWKAHYQEKYVETRDELEAIHADKVRKAMEREERATAVYIPPHIRRMAELDKIYSKEHKGGALGSFKQYQYMVEMQVKAKFFDKMEAISHNRTISVGISDDTAREMTIEFYQARWISLDRRLKKLLKKKKPEPLRLGRKVYWEHPWGPRVEEFPGSLDGVMEMCLLLDQHAWTLNPVYVWEKLQKSITEMWEDIANEIQTICQYIDETQLDLAEEQTEVLAQRRAEDVMRGLAGIEAINLPAVGYRAPYLLPARQIEIPHDAGGGSYTAQVAPLLHNQQPEPDDTTLPEISEDEGALFLQAQRQLMEALEAGSDSEDERETYLFRPADRVAYLSLNEIWEELGMEDMPDSRKKIVLGVPADVSLTAPHMDPLIAPVVVTTDKTKTRRIWQSKMSIMRRRLGLSEPAAMDEDM